MWFWDRDFYIIIIFFLYQGFNLCLWNLCRKYILFPTSGELNKNWDVGSKVMWEKHILIWHTHTKVGDVKVEVIDDMAYEMVLRDHRCQDGIMYIDLLACYFPCPFCCLLSFILNVLYIVANSDLISSQRRFLLSGTWLSSYLAMYPLDNA